jgi:hypothetical protein
MQVQAPRRQKFGSTHALPQYPQLASSVFTLTHTPEQLVYPTSHAHAHAPAVHAQCALTGSVPLQLLHAPPQHTAGDPHEVPSPRLPVGEHVDAPVAHEVVPLWQADGLHETPAVHATHEPPLHTMFVPHEVPSATLPVALHVGVPVEQSVCPFWQGLPAGLHGWFAVHAPH